MKPQGAVGSDAIGYHVSTGVMSGTSTACFGEEGEGDDHKQENPQTYEVRMPNESLLSYSGNSIPYKQHVNIFF